MAGLEGRCNLLINLGEAIEKRPDVCAGGRPGDMLGMSFPSYIPFLSTVIGD